MANVFLNDVAYSRLKAAKKQGQSFSDLVIEIVPMKTKFSDMLGAFPDIDAKKISAEIRKERRKGMD